jgi:hypothetical protein
MPHKLQVDAKETRNQCGSLLVCGMGGTIERKFLLLRVSGVISGGSIFVRVRRQKGSNLFASILV